MAKLKQTSLLAFAKVSEDKHEDRNELLPENSAIEGEHGGEANAELIVSDQGAAAVTDDGSTRPLSYSLGSPLSNVLTSVGDYETAVHSYHQKGQKYVMRFQRSKGKVSIALHRDCGVADQLKAALVVEILNYVTKHKDFAPVSSGLDMPSVAAMTLNSPLQSSHSELLRGLTAPRDDGALLLMFAQSVVEKHFTSIVSALQTMGWVTSHHLLGVEEWRYHWVSRSNERQLRN